MILPAVMVCATPSGDSVFKDKRNAGQPVHIARATKCTCLAFSLLSNQGKESVTISKAKGRGAASVGLLSIFHVTSDL